MSNEAYVDFTNCSVTGNEFTLMVNLKPSISVQPYFVCIFPAILTNSLLKISLRAWQVKVSVLRLLDETDSGVPFMRINNITIDLCRFHNGQVSSNLMKTISLDTCSNTQHPCPHSVIIIFDQSNHRW